MDVETAPTETYQPLLHDVQHYLRALLSSQTADTILSEAWSEFYRVYSELIRRYVISRGVRHADVDDCVQEVWCAVATRLAEFQHPGDRPGLRAWLYALVRSKTTDLVRKRNRQPARSLQDEIEAGREPGDDDANPAYLYEQKWRDAMLETALQDLKQEISETNYRILHMRLIERKHVPEVAQELGMKPEQVRYRQHRSLQKLKARLAVYTGDNIGSQSV